MVSPISGNNFSGEIPQDLRKQVRDEGVLIHNDLVDLKNLAKGGKTATDPVTSQTVGPFPHDKIPVDVLNDFVADLREKCSNIQELQKGLDPQSSKAAGNYVNQVDTLCNYLLNDCPVTKGVSDTHGLDAFLESSGYRGAAIDFDFAFGGGV